MTREVARAAAAALFCAPGAACQPLPDVQYEGQIVDVAPYFDAEVCAGTVAWLDRTVVEITDATGLPPPDRATFYWGWEGSRERCPEGAFACAFEESNRVFSMAAFARHELAHIVGFAVGRADELIEEGFAVAADNGCAGFDRSMPSVSHLVGGPTDSVSLVDLTEAGGHFANYLVNRWGWPPYLALKATVPRGSTPAEFEDAFFDAYGVSLAEVTAQWQLEAPQIVCPDVPRFNDAVWAGEGLRLEASLDCSSNTTMGPIDETTFRVPSLSLGIVPGMFEERWIDIPFGANVDIVVDGPPGTSVWLAPRWCVRPSRDDSERTNEDNLFEVAAGDEVIGHELGACRYRTWFVSDSYDPASIVLELRPHEDGAR